MNYPFKCPKCFFEVDIEIPMKDYSQLKDKQVCYKCGCKLERVIQWEGPATINGGYEAVAGKASWQS